MTFRMRLKLPGVGRGRVFDIYRRKLGYSDVSIYKSAICSGGMFVRGDVFNITIRTPLPCPAMCAGVFNRFDIGVGISATRPSPLGR